MNGECALHGTTGGCPCTDPGLLAPADLYRMSDAPPGTFWCARCRAYVPLSEMRKHD